MLANWIDPSPVKQFHKNYKKYKITPYSESKSLEFNGVPSKIAIIGQGVFTRNIREAFYSLDLESFIVDIADLGDIRNNDVSLMTAAYKELFLQNIFPIVIDSSTNTSLAFANALKNIKKETNFGIVSPTTHKSSNSYNIYSNLIDGDKVNSLSFLAYQKHYANPSNQTIPKLDLSGLLSLGKLRDDIREAEPILRNQNLLAFDIKSIKASNAIGLKNHKNNGLTAEEACQLLQYATSSSNLRGLHLYGFELNTTQNTEVGAELIACLIWYSLIGNLKSRRNQQLKNEMTNYIVDLDSYGHQLYFWKNEKSEHWWVEIPDLKNNSGKLIPCSEKEYLLAKENKISDRLFNILAHY